MRSQNEKVLATQDDRTNVAGRDRRDQAVVGLLAMLGHKGWWIQLTVRES
jgi:hypothetical protein